MELARLEPASFWLAAHDERVRCAVAEPLAARRSERKERPDQVEGETVNQAQHVADDRCAEAQGSPKSLENAS